MAVYKIIKLHFNSPLHLSRGKGDYDISEPILHSDTISSSICAIAHEVISGFDSEEFLNLFKVSSGFPFSGKTLFFPKPLLRLPIKIPEYDEKMSSKEGKLFKTLEYIDLTYISKIINATDVIPIRLDDFRSKNKLLTTANIDSIYEFETQQRVSVSRDNSDSTPYYIERTFFSNGCGLFFIYQCENNSLLEKALTALTYLGDEGIGTDRTVGNGHFSVELDEFSLKTPSSDHQIALSLFCPTKGEIESGILDNCSYNLIKRGGYIAGATNPLHRHLKKKSIYMFSEGSVFKHNKPIAGKIVDLRPDWKDSSLPAVFRSGKPITIPTNVLDYV